MHIFKLFINIRCLVHVKSIKKNRFLDANFLSVYIIVHNMNVYVICLHAWEGKWAKPEQSSYELCKTRNKGCGSFPLMTSDQLLC
jgi:hypothetical protein